ncbi:unnamed protein product [Meloidogyne enterolobii]|uniref:Uncharacterized protein n=1 Tax=Meloidogyne enterolobii TaxID=390850 RepID=A0ACB0Z1J3_MELEN
MRSIVLMFLLAVVVISFEKSIARDSEGGFPRGPPRGPPPSMFEDNKDNRGGFRARPNGFGGGDGENGGPGGRGGFGGRGGGQGGFGGF